MCPDLDFNPKFDFIFIYLSRMKYALEVHLENFF